MHPQSQAIRTMLRERQPSRRGGSHSRRNLASSLISRVVQEQPLTVALVGAAAGGGRGSCFSHRSGKSDPRTGERLRDAAGRAGEQLKDAATKAGQRLAAAADERHLEGLKEVARDVGETFSSAWKARKLTKSLHRNHKVHQTNPGSATNQRDS